jgi:hypothetical protein
MTDENKNADWEFGKDSPRTKEDESKPTLAPEAIQAPAPEPYVVKEVKKPPLQTYDPSPAKPPIKSGHVTSEDILHPKHSTSHKHATSHPKKPSK